MSQVDLMLPGFALGVMEIQIDEKSVMDVMTIEITTGSVQFTARIADRSNYRQVADKLAEGIRRMGAEMQGPHVKLITVKELPDGLRKTQRG